MIKNKKGTEQRFDKENTVFSEIEEFLIFSVQNRIKVQDEFQQNSAKWR